MPRRCDRREGCWPLESALSGGPDWLRHSHGSGACAPRPGPPPQPGSGATPSRLALSVSTACSARASPSTAGPPWIASRSGSARSAAGAVWRRRTGTADPRRAVDGSACAEHPAANADPRPRLISTAATKGPVTPRASACARSSETWGAPLQRRSNSPSPARPSGRPSTARRVGSSAATSACCGADQT